MRGSGEGTEIVIDDSTALPAALHARLADTSPNGGLLMGLRPEAITDPKSAGRGSNIAKADCYIEVVETTGSDTFVVSRLAGGEVMARLRADTLVDAGQTMLLAFDLSKAVFFDKASGHRV